MFKAMMENLALKYAFFKVKRDPILGSVWVQIQKQIWDYPCLSGDLRLERDDPPFRWTKPGPAVRTWPPGSGTPMECGVPAT